MFHDFTQYLVTIVGIALLSQWTWIYQVLSNPAKAAANSKSKFFEKCLLVASLIFTFLLMNDFVSIYDMHINAIYATIINVLMMIYILCLIIAFCVLYILFVRLINSD
jgi:hypothetical protein